VLLARKPLRTAFGAQTAYAFWLLVPAALIAALLPARTIVEVLPEASAVLETAAAAPVEISATVAQATNSAPALPPLEPLALLLWSVGAALSVLIALNAQRRIDGDAAGPAVVGVLRPRILLPRDFSERYNAEERALVLAHEQSHVNAGDVQINALAALIQALNWFNPLIYIARAALRVDQELACDARVMARHAGAKRTYAEAMLKTQLAARAVPLGCAWPPLGAGPLKQRIAMLADPAPTPRRRVAGALLCTLTVLAAGAAAWLAQPPRVAYAHQGADNTDTDTDHEDANPLRALFDLGGGGALIDALMEGDRASALQMIDRGADVNHWRPGDGTPLTIAARMGDAALVRALLEAGANPNTRAPGDGNPLIMAAAMGNRELIALYLSHGADVDGYVRGDETPLINAARENRLDAARQLIASGADVNLTVEAPTIAGVEQRSPLSEARRHGHTEMIRLLIAHGARS